ncbi:hypothetical protein KGF56_002243 [Candida oxycetoniae]|uniref:ABC transporter domain-containing protein n=1 Tax=Candida oxycetoniae TaxID=497107 RepID=A0AAI9SYD4_9ASCO|nr:uncharacterized protein KGF56_002243 [Candida oxycetoniae]KAI3404914.2 hypothetical protein KGF56_002243 [Candida oxycetoniae]
MSESNVLEIPYDQRVGLSVRNLSVAIKSKLKKQKKDFSSTDVDIDLETEDFNRKSSRILNDISFDVKPGELVALMGGSGAGKTTLLHTLSQRTNINNKKLEFSGSVTYTRAPATSSSSLSSPQDFSQCTIKHIKHAYLLQTDFFLPGLTVLETFQSQADLRLPPYVSRSEKNELIDYILKVLNLDHLKNTRICQFSSLATTLSGGEQRRVSLAIQLLSRPSILFLDEPTTGLDTSSSLKLVQLLKKLASNEYGITIILSIHQPRAEICDLFDKVCLLTSGGRLVYFGDLKNQALDYFGKLGYNSDLNISQYVMKLSVKDASTVENEAASVKRINYLVDHWKSINDYEYNSSVKLDSKQFSSNLKLFSTPKRDQISHFRQLVVLTKRSFKTSYRDYKSLLVLNFGILILAITLGWMFYRPKHDLAGIRSLISTQYVMLEVVGFCAMFIETERLWNTDGACFFREYKEHVSSIPNFIISRRLAKFLLEDLPMTVLFSVVTFFMWGMRVNDGSYFGIYFTIVLLTQLCCMSGAILMFAVAPSFPITTLLVNLFYQLQNSASGYFVNASTMPVYVKWTKYIAYFWYGFGALVANQFTNWVGDCPYNDYDDPRCAEYSGNVQLAILGYPEGWIAEPIGILIGWVVGLLVLTGVALYFRSYDGGMAKTKKNKLGNEEGEGIHHLEAEMVGSNEKTDLIDNNNNNNSNCSIEINLFNIHLAIREKPFFGKSKGLKTLLNNVNATFKANTVNAIMGPSGSGKSTCLNYLSNRLDRSTKFLSSGNIKVNSIQNTSRSELSKISSYVTQHDSSLIADLTVRETLYYQARLRLPVSQRSAIPKIVNKLIRQTGLIDCADTLVGNEFIKGISGGEKRRLSISIQLLSKPKVLFLDEPTSGLDSSTAEAILELLNELAVVAGTTVILTIHQPSEELFYKFGSLLLLGKGGNVIYNGTTIGVLQYMSQLGFVNSKNKNAADYILDLVSSSNDEDEQVVADRITKLTNKWVYQETLNEKNEHTSITNNSITSDYQVIDLSKFYFKRLPFLYTFPTITERQFVTSYRSKDSVLSRMGQTVFLTIVHTLFFAPLRNTQDGIANRLGLIQEVLNLYFVGLVNNLSLYPFERNLFFQEYRDGIYGVTEFGLSYLLNELPTEIVPTFFFSALIVFVCGLPRNATMFFSMFATGFVSINCGESLGIFVNSVFKHMEVAANILSNIIIIAIFMGGTMSLHMPGFFKGINYISPMKYAVSICANLGFKDQVFDCDVGECSLRTGQDVLASYNLEANVGAMFGGLIACLVLYRVVAIVSIYVRVKWF